MNIIQNELDYIEYLLNDEHLEKHIYGSDNEKKSPIKVIDIVHLRFFKFIKKEDFIKDSAIDRIYEFCLDKSIPRCNKCRCWINSDRYDYCGFRGVVCDEDIKKIFNK